MRRMAVVIFAVLICTAWALPFPSPSVQGRRVESAAAYRTVIVFGDTQDASKDAGKLANLQTMADWITANKETENIDFVLQVGDFIDAGTFAPLPAFCATAEMTAPFASCAAANDTDSGTCTALEGGDECYWDAANTDCITCAIMNTTNGLDVPGQWTDILGVFDDLEPGADTVDGVPFGVVGGNHDNPGPGGTLGYPQPDGQDPNHDATYWEGLETAFVGKDRLFQHIKTVDHGDAGLSHTYRMRIGSQDIMVVAPAFQGGGPYSTETIEWAQNEFDTYGLPVWILAHDIVQDGGTFNAATWDATVAHEAIMAVSGGHSPVARVLDIRTNRGHQILRSVTDYSGSGVADDDWAFFTVFRFYDDGDVEIFDSNRVLDSTTSGVSKTAFTFPDPFDWSVPADLTPYEDELFAAFDDNAIARPSWPTAPDITDTCTPTAGNESELRACLGAGVRTIVPAGTYTLTASLSSTASNQWLDGQPGSIIQGAASFTGDNIRISGVEFEGIGTNSRKISFSSDDLLIYNVNFDLDTHNKDSFDLCLSGPCNRVAVVNTTCVAARYCGSITESTTHSDYMFVNYDAHSLNVACDDTPPTFPTDNGPDGEACGADENTHRSMRVTRLAMLGSHMRVAPTQKPPVRVHYGGLGVLYAQNILDCTPGASCLWIDTSAGGGIDACSGVPREYEDIESVYVLNNTIYHDGTRLRDIQIDDSLDDGSGCDLATIINVVVDGNESHASGGSTTTSSIIGGTNVTSGVEYTIGTHSAANDFSAFPAFTGGADH